MVQLLDTKTLRSLVVEVCNDIVKDWCERDVDIEERIEGILGRCIAETIRCAGSQYSMRTQAKVGLKICARKYGPNLRPIFCYDAPSMAMCGDVYVTYLPCVPF